MIKNFYWALSRRFQCHLEKKQPDAKVFCLEWEHGYYGARQSWVQEWVSCKGWDVSLSPHSGSCLPHADRISSSTSAVTMRRFPYSFEEDKTSNILSLLRPCSEVIVAPSYGLSRATALDSGSLCSSGRHGLESLPQELLSIIISYLSTPDIFRLRRCSKTLALYLPLDQQLWREGLITGNVIGWLWDLDKDECRGVDHLQYTTRIPARGWDWRRLVLTLAEDPFPTEKMDLSGKLPKAEDWKKWFSDKTIAVSNDSEDLPTGLRNRRRIWKIIKGIDPIPMEHSREELQGDERKENLDIRQGKCKESSSSSSPEDTSSKEGEEDKDTFSAKMEEDQFLSGIPESIS